MKRGHETRLDPNSPDFYNLATVMKHGPDTLPPGFEGSRWSKCISYDCSSRHGLHSGR